MRRRDVEHHDVVRVRLQHGGEIAAVHGVGPPRDQIADLGFVVGHDPSLLVRSCS
ncbi:hypothetical protein ACFQ60_19805 [Streptomyces zhihengii]